MPYISTNIWLSTRRQSSFPLLFVFVSSLLSDWSWSFRYGEGWDFGEVANNGRGVNASQFNLNGTGIGRCYFLFYIYITCQFCLFLFLFWRKIITDSSFWKELISIMLHTKLSVTNTVYNLVTPIWFVSVFVTKWFLWCHLYHVILCIFPYIWCLLIHRSLQFK